jgi:integrase
MDDGVWLASVPLRRGLKKRVYGTFAPDADAAADAWMAEQVARLESGLEAVGPTRKGRASRAGSKASLAAPAPAVQEWLTFEEYALAWHHEQYVMLHRGGPERGQAVLRNLQLHILPTFGGPIEVDVARGRAKLVEWTRKMAGYPAVPGDPVDPQAKTYARKVVGQLLWIISEVYLYARGLGAPVAVVPGQLHEMPALTNDVTAMNPKGRTKRKAGLISFAEARRLAGEMHAIHQLVLWLMRVAGFRIGESYGLLVSNFLDDGEWGYLLVEAQGGRTYLVRGEDERPVPTTRKMTLKSNAGYRLIALPHSLSRLIRQVIEDFHTDPVSGVIDASARLIPSIRSEGGGAAGFRSALKKVSRAVAGVDIAEDNLVIPHDMRKGFATDLAWTPGLEDVVKRRAMGHRGGRDVFDLIYTLDDRLCEAMKPAAAAVEREIADSIGNLIVPTTVRPSYSASADRARLATLDAALEERGWQVRTCEDGWVEASEAAAILSMTVTATRRLFPDQIPAVKLEGKWRARLGDVEAYRERFDGWWRIEDVCDKVGATYHEAYAMVKRLNVQTVMDNYSRQLLLTGDQAGELITEFSRIEDLHLRSMPVAEAASFLGVSHSSMGEWAKSGKIVVDAESDASGKRFVTRVSVQEECDRRGRKRREIISAGELKEYSGLDDTGTRALVARGVLVRGPRGGYTTESVIAWMTGYRPDLLTCGLIRFE